MANVHRILGDNEAWVEFKASGYPFSLRKQLKEAGDDEAVIEIICKYVDSCELPTLDGKKLTSFSTKADLQNVDEKLVADIIWKFYDFRAERLREPLGKNI